MSARPRSSQADHIDELRRQHPDTSSVLFDVMEERQEIQDRLRTLQSAIAGLVGEYGYHAKCEDNTRLAALVAELDAAVQSL